MIEDEDEGAGLKITRRIPLTVALMLLAQMAGVLIWATQLEARVGGMEQETINSASLNEKFARLEERLDNVKHDIEGLKHQIDRLTDKLIQP